MRLFFKYLILLSITVSAPVFAKTFPLNGNEVFGEVFTVTPKKNDTFSYYAHTYDVGASAIQIANPGVNEDYPDKQKHDITIPAEFILPSQRNGIVINLPEIRLYYFNQSEFMTYPVSIGKVGWKTPIREGKVVDKEANPSWHVPKSILAENAARGVHTPAVVGPGPNNPLGKYALRLSIPGYLIHGTSNPTSIGRRVSHGCIRMFPMDIEELFNNVPVGTPVSLINEPIKAGWKGNKLYLEVHPLLAEYPMSEDARQAMAKDKINAALAVRSTQVDWSKVDQVMRAQNGVVEMISK
ncbi:MAG: L,D-transpeptidase family protein [Legionellales bacterium]|jgi:L,D-transpeptidase ErfK/SrfK